MQRHKWTFGLAAAHLPRFLTAQRSASICPFAALHWRRHADGVFHSVGPEREVSTVCLVTSGRWPVLLQGDAWIHRLAHC